MNPLLNTQYRLWCILRKRDPEKYLSVVVFQAIAETEDGRLHLEAMGPHTAEWKRIAAQAGWQLNERGQLRKKR